MARLEGATGEVAECIAIAEEMIAAESRLVETLSGDASASDQALACGKVREIANEHSVAEGFYRQALRLAPDDLEALARLAIVVLKQGDTVEGLSLARQLEEADPGYVFRTITGKPATSMTVLGDALRLNGELSRANEAYQASVERTKGKDGHSLGHLADGLLRARRVDEATAVLEQFAEPGQLEGLQASASLLRNDPNSVASLRPAIERDLVGFIHESPI